VDTGRALLEVPARHVDDPTPSLAPLVLGQRGRLFPAPLPERAFRLVGTQAFR